MSKKVLIPIDWSENAEKAFDWYIYNLHHKGYLVILTHYIEASSKSEYERKETQMLELQEIYETRLLQMKIEHRWITGTKSAPGEHIIKVAKEEQVHMIVLGARGLGKIRKAILGSVSDYVINKAKCPVLVCKLPS